MEERGSEPRRDVARIFTRARNWDKVPLSVELAAIHVTPHLWQLGGWR